MDTSTNDDSLTHLCRHHHRYSSLLPIQLSATPSRISLRIQRRTRTQRYHAYIERVLVLRAWHSVLVQWFSSRRSDSPWRLTRGRYRGSINATYTHPPISPSLILSLLPPLSPLPPSPFILPAVSHVYGVSLQRRHQGVAWSRLKVPNVDRIPNWVGGVSAKGRLAQVEVRGEIPIPPRSAYLSSRAPSFPVYSAITALRCRLWMETRVGRLHERVTRCLPAIRPEEKVFNGNPDQWSEELSRCRKIGNCVL